MVDIDNVSFSYGEEEKNGIEDINIRVRKGECVLLCGPSGCGKTTVTKLVNGLIPHFDEGKLEGTVTVDDMRVAETPLYRLSLKVGSVFQNPKSQFFNIDSDSELAFGLENNGTDPEVIKKRIAATVSDLHIEHLTNRNVFSMSGGEKQSLAFASVYAMDPDIYVLDEPSANLDSKATEVLKQQIAAVKAQGKTVVIAEHRLYYLSDLVDRVIIIKGGKVFKEYTQEGFRALSDDERHAMGLRTISSRTCCIETPPSETGELRIEDLKVELGKRTVFEGVDFTASAGEVLGMTGHNGAGKSTMLRCIAGLQKESAGKILYKGDALSRKQRNRLCYMIMQDVNHQLFGESVWDECMIACRGDDREENIRKILTEFDLLDMKDRHPMALSGGQKQRLAIAAGILAEKKVMLFDEPTSGLDYAHMLKVSSMMRRLAERGHIVIVVTHDTELLNCTCDRVIKFGDMR